MSTPISPETSLQKVSWIQQKLRVLIGDAFHMSLKVMSSAGKYAPGIQKRLKKLKIITNQSYGPIKKWHTLDIYELHESSNRVVSHGLKPAVLYVHGGGFRILSKDTHWPFALKFAEAGFVVFNINYRLSTDSPCPAGLEDAATALLWLISHAEAYGVDPQQIYLAGESAGGNLVTSLALCCVRPSPYQWSQVLFEKAQAGWSPRAVLPACAFLDVKKQSSSRAHLSKFIQGRMDFLVDTYVQDQQYETLANPLLELESDQVFTYPLPPFFINVSIADPVAKDSERLALALKKRNVDHIYQAYPKGIHAFHAIIWSSLAKKCWQDHFDFLASYTK